MRAQKERLAIQNENKERAMNQLQDELHKTMKDLEETRQLSLKYGKTNQELMAYCEKLEKKVRDFKQDSNENEKNLNAVINANVNANANDANTHKSNNYSKSRSQWSVELSLTQEEMAQVETGIQMAQTKEEKNYKKTKEKLQQLEIEHIAIIDSLQREKSVLCVCVCEVLTV